MRRYHKWFMALGIAAATPGITLGGPWPFSSSKPTAAPTAGAPAVKGRNNQEVAEDIAKALRSAKLQGYDIQVMYQNGVATLQGSVTSPELRATATQVVSRVRGVQAVNNRLLVGAKSSPPAAAVAAKQIAAQQTAAKRTAAKPPAKPSARSAVQQVQYEAPAEEAPQLAAPPVAPANAVAEQTPSQPSTEENQRTAEAIAEALRSARFSGQDIEIQYLNGVATLGGAVASPAIKASATAIISQVDGVQRVDNRLSVAPQIQATAADVAQGPPAQNTQMQAQVAAPPVAAPPGAPYPPQGAPYPPQGGGYPPPGAGYPPPGPPYGPGAVPAGYGPPPAMMAQGPVFDQPNMPNHSWPTYATYPNYAQVNYPKQYSASAWPYIGPFYPYPQIPLGWRKAQLEWDDGYWNLNFRPRTDRWWWFMDPRNW